MLTAIDNNDDDNTFVSTATATNITATTNKKDIYNQTCSNVGLCKTTTHLRQPVLGQTKQFPIQSLLYERTTCLTQTDTPFLLPNEKNLPKQPLENFT